ncbi:MAG: hypothetical protein V3W31_00090 [Thermodesulfobacteriota bacterium]
MRSYYLPALLVCSVLVGLLFVAATPSMAIHRGAGNLVCGNCHTMHNSQGNDDLGGAVGGSIILLRGSLTNRAQMHRLCLQCHAEEGAQANNSHSPHGQTAPKVLTGLVWNEATDIGFIGSGGNFRAECSDLTALTDCTDAAAGGSPYAQGYGHSIGMTTVTPPGMDTSEGASDVASFSCSSCHDSHGAGVGGTNITNTFRNLKKTPHNSGDTVTIDALTTSWVGGVTGTSGSGTYTPYDGGGGKTQAIWPIYNTTVEVSQAGLTNLANDSPNSNAYGAGTGGIAYWCAACHDDWHEENNNDNDAADLGISGRASAGDWRRHPVDETIHSPGNVLQESGSGIPIIDTSTYDATAAGQVLPVVDGNTTLNQRVFYLSANDEDRVFCLSCHFAHGGPYYDNLRWNYLDAVTTGNQTGLGIASNRGCQLCHNR